MGKGTKANRTGREREVSLESHDEGEDTFVSLEQESSSATWAVLEMEEASLTIPALSGDEGVTEDVAVFSESFAHSSPEETPSVPSSELRTMASSALAFTDAYDAHTSREDEADETTPSLEPVPVTVLPSAEDWSAPRADVWSLGDTLEAPPDLISMLNQDDSRNLEGHTLGKWRLESWLGEGGMSVVYRARHLVLAQEAAIKVLLPGHYKDRKSLRRFQQEANAASRLQHPNIIEVKDFGVDERHGYFMVLELLEGQDLETLVRQAPLPISWIVGVFEQICDALHLTHSAGIVHRDLKPPNVFLLPGEPFPKVKLLDFGVAKVLFEEQRTNLTSTGVIIGTPAYLAPEQVAPNAPISPATDVYALGVMLFVLLTGKLPLQGRTAIEQVIQVLQSPAPKAGEIRPSLAGTALESLIAQMLAKDPAHRPTSVQEMMVTLRDAAADFADPLDRVEHYPSIKVSPREKAAPTSYDFVPFEVDGAQVFPASALSPVSLPIPSGVERILAEKGEDAESSLEQDVKVPALAMSSASAAFEPASKRTWWWGLALLLCLGVLGLGGWWWSTKRQKVVVPPPAASRVQASVRGLDALVVRGVKAFQSQDTQGAIRLWKKAIHKPVWKRTVHYPKLLRAIGVAYQERKALYNASFFLKRYRKAVTRQRRRIARLSKRLAKLPTSSKKALKLARRIRGLEARLPSAKAVEQDFQRIDALQSLLSKQSAYAKHTLSLWRKQLEEGLWREGLQLFAKTKGTWSITPRVALQSLRTVGRFFPALALMQMDEWLKKLELHTGQLRHWKALQKVWRQRIAKWKKKWRLSLSRVEALLQRKQYNTAWHLLSQSLKTQRILERAPLHRIWRAWMLQRLQKPKSTDRGLWKLAIKHQKTFAKSALQLWVQLQFPAVPTVKRLQQELALLGHHALLSRLRQKWEQEERRASFVVALQNLQRLQRAWQKLPPKRRARLPIWSSLTGQMNRTLHRLKRSVKHQRQSSALFRKARFAAANVESRALLALWSKSAPVQKVLARAWDKRRVQEKKAQFLLRRARRTYKRGRWKESLGAWKSYLSLFPLAHNRAWVKKRAKACSCALNIYPWEVCRKTDLPQHMKKKR